MIHDLSNEATHMALGALRLLRPHTAEGVEKIRVGRFFDGGYVMVDKFEGIEAAYSLGINDDVSWDLDMACRGIPIFQYDHTIDGLPDQHPLFNWEPICISGQQDSANNVESLESLIAKNKHERYRNMLLKCDIEGSEWYLLARTPNGVLAQFSQIVIEIHNMAYLSEMHHANNVRRALDNLTASHKVVHVHANNFSPWAIVGGVPVPTVLELTLLRHDMAEMAPSDEVFPTPLDMPCNSRVADFYLGRFAYE